jgi:hypothetical protein
MEIHRIIQMLYVCEIYRIDLRETVNVADFRYCDEEI